VTSGLQTTHMYGGYSVNLTVLEKNRQDKIPLFSTENRQ